MGEYVNVRGVGEIKIGTCENMYYVARDEFEALVKQGRCTTVPGNANPHVYVQEADKLLWRFPWPSDEPIGEREYSRTFVLHADVGAGLAAAEHKHVTVHLQAPGGGYGVNVRVPCPSGEHRVNHAPDGTVFKIVGEATKGGHRCTVFACVYCDARFYCTRSEIQSIREQYAKRYSDGSYSDILERLTGVPD